MLAFIRFLPAFSTIVFLSGMFVLTLRPGLVWIIGAILTVWNILSVYLLAGRQWRSLTFWSLLILPFWLYLSSQSIVLFITSSFIRWGITIIIPFALGFYYRQIFHYHYSPGRYQPFALENLSNGFALVVMFFASASLYGMIVFLGFNWFMLLPFWVLVVVSVSYEMLWVKKTLDVRGWRWFAVFSIMLSEVFIVMSFFPTNFIVNGAVITIIYYTLVAMHRAALKEKIERNMILRPLVLSFILLVIILGTASWV
ncbi:MAG: hypothetical protein H6760_02395 [Candidatus Nomurabacteria bacterium]|nr:MAG: hypothetical protein H6760_02395 [Candidatus Nomurabacteria bacterium]